MSEPTFPADAVGAAAREVLRGRGGFDELARVHAQDIVSAGASLVVDHRLSSRSLDAAPTYASAGIIQIAPSSESQNR